MHKNSSAAQNYSSLELSLFITKGDLKHSCVVMEAVDFNLTRFSCAQKLPKIETENDVLLNAGQ